MVEEIRYLKQYEKDNSRELWRHAFPDDSESFTDYYYHEVIPKNRIMVLENEVGIASMLHLNPYRIVIKDQVWDSEYIVGVATRADQRRRGYMRKLIERMFLDLYRQKMQFCFLMPAHESIYLPFDFTYIFEQPQFKLNKNHGLDMKDGDQISNHVISEWMNHYLSERYDLYSYRDQAYVEQLLKEIKSEDGQCRLLYQENNLVGIRAEWGLVKREQRMLLCREDFCYEDQLPKPAIMARIIDLSAFITIITLKKETIVDFMEVTLMVKDQWIANNNGIFRWRIDKDGSSIKRVGFNENNFEISISQLTSWLFGYRKLNELIEGEIPEWTGQVQVINGIFLDEIV